MVDTIISNSEVQSRGGAIYVSDGRMKISSGCQFLDSKATLGGAPGTSTAESGGRGGTFFIAGGEVTMEESMILRSEANLGGAVWLGGGVLRMTVSNISHTTRGGAIAFTGSGVAELQNVSLDYNQISPKGLGDTQQ
eukprot:591642-Prymnesium_polylepis.1